MTTTSNKTGSSQENPVDMTTSTSTTASTSNTDATIGEKRKAPTSTSTSNAQTGETNGNGEEGGKDLVEKKQTTLDDIVHSEKDKSDSAEKKEVEGKKGEEGQRPAKRSKIDSGKENVVGERDEKEKEGNGEKEGKVDIDMKSPSSKSKSDSKPTDADSKPTASNTELTQPISQNENASTNQTPAKANAADDTVPGDEAHLDHPENWTTGDEPATDKQKGYLKVLEKQNGVSVGDVDNIGKSEASEKIDQNTSASASATTTTTTKPANAAAKEIEEETVPGDEAHLDHPENWTTGGDPATDKQKGFLKVLEKQKGVPVGDLEGIGKSEASEKIDEFKNICESEV